MSCIWSRRWLLRAILPSAYMQAQWATPYIQASRKAGLSRAARHHCGAWQRMHPCPLRKIASAMRLHTRPPWPATAAGTTAPGTSAAKEFSPLQCGCMQHTPPRAAACLKAQNQRLSLENHALPTKMGAAHPGSWTAWGTPRTHCCSRPADKTRRSPKMYSPGAVTSPSQKFLVRSLTVLPCPCPSRSSQLTSSPTARPKSESSSPTAQSKIETKF